MARWDRGSSGTIPEWFFEAVETPWHHPLYRKTIRRMVNYKAHDEKNQCHLGDTVRIMETRPVSKDKRWRVVEIINKGEVAEVQPEEIA